MDLQLQQIRKAEHRAVCFLLKEALGFDRRSKVWKQMARHNASRLFAFDALRSILPGFELALEYIQLSHADRPSLKSLIRRDKSCRLIQALPEFGRDVQQGLVFNFGGIKGGLILHNFDLPSDRQSASMFWELPGGRVRLQRFAEFCLALRASNFELPKSSQGSPLPVSSILANLSISDLKPLAIRTCLFLMSAHGDPQVVRDLQACGHAIAFETEEAKSYLRLPHPVMAELFSCDVSSVKRTFAELVERGFITCNRFGRHAGYRFSSQLYWENQNDF